MATEKRLISLDEAIAKIKDDGILGAGYDDAEREDDVIDMLESCRIVDAVEVDKFNIKLHHILIDNEGVPEVKLQIGDRYFILRTDPVDVREVVHGRWVIEKRHTVSRNPYMDDNYHAHATCSECGFCIHSENASFGYPELKTTNYCPNCGAKRRGSEE